MITWWLPGCKYNVDEYFKSSHGKSEELLYTSSYSCSFREAFQISQHHTFLSSCGTIGTFQTVLLMTCSHVICLVSFYH